MIIKKVPDPKHSASVADRIRALTKYIVRPELTDSAEKCLYAGARGFICADLRDQQNEMIGLATAPRRASNPIIHYVLSWHEDEVPTSQDIEEAVDLFLGHLGLAECQAIYGLHVDTSNAHLHICVNRVDPVEEKLIRINGGFDLEAAHQAIAIIEEHQGWRRETNARYVASGPNVYRSGWDAERPEISAAARDKELRKGAISVETKAHHVLKLALESAPNWAEFHHILGRAGMVYRKEGNGAIVIIDGVQVKASKALRAASWSKLVKHFGAFEEATEAPITDPDFAPWLGERREATCAIIGKGDASASIDWQTVDGFEAYCVDGRTYYSRRRGGAVSFVDEGARIRVLDSRDEEAARAALRLAAAKWPDGLQIEGPADWKRLLARLAAEEGIQISNPEMQADIKKERAIRARKLAAAGRRRPLIHALASITSCLHADRYELLVPGRIQSRPKAGSVNQVLASADGRGFDPFGLVDALQDAEARGARRSEIQLVPRAIDRDYVWASAKTPENPTERPALPGAARLAVDLPDRRSLAIGSMPRSSSRAALGDLADELASPPEKNPGSAKRAQLAAHAIPLEFTAMKGARVISASHDDSSVLPDRLNTIDRAKRQTERSLVEIGLPSPVPLRPPPSPDDSTPNIEPSDQEAYRRLRTVVMLDFPADLRIHPSRIDAAIALRLRAIGRSPVEVESIVKASKADQRADPYVTAAIYAGRIRDFAWSTAAELWLVDHKHLAEVWRAIARGQPIDWRETEAATRSDNSDGQSFAHAQILGGTGRMHDRPVMAAVAAPQEPTGGQQPIHSKAKGVGALGATPLDPVKPKAASWQESDQLTGRQRVGSLIGLGDHLPIIDEDDAINIPTDEFREKLERAATELRGEIEFGGPLDRHETAKSRKGRGRPISENTAVDEKTSTRPTGSAPRRSGLSTNAAIDIASSPTEAAPETTPNPKSHEHMTAGQTRFPPRSPPSPPENLKEPTQQLGSSHRPPHGASARATTREAAVTWATSAVKPEPKSVLEGLAGSPPIFNRESISPSPAQSTPPSTGQARNALLRAVPPPGPKRPPSTPDGSPPPTLAKDLSGPSGSRPATDNPAPIQPSSLPPAKASLQPSVGRSDPATRAAEESGVGPQAAGVPKSISARAETAKPQTLVRPGISARAGTPAPSRTADSATAEAIRKANQEPPPSTRSSSAPPAASGSQPAGAVAGSPESLLADLMCGLPKQVPILLQATQAGDDDASTRASASDPLATVKRLALAFPDALVPCPPGRDQHFEVSSVQNTEQVMRTALGKSARDGELARQMSQAAIAAIQKLTQPRWKDLASHDPCPLYRSEPNSPLRALVRLWVDHRRVLDQPDIKDHPDDAYRAHWVCHHVASNLAPLLPESRLNPLTNWPNVCKAVGMSIVAELTLTAPRIDPKRYAATLAEAYREAGRDAISDPSAGLRLSVFPPARPSDLNDDQRKRLLLANRLDSFGQPAMADKLLATDPILRAFHNFARATKATPDGPDRESLIAALKATRRATLDPSYVEARLLPLGASSGLIQRIAAQSPNTGRRR